MASVVIGALGVLFHCSCRILSFAWNNRSIMINDL